MNQPMPPLPDGQRWYVKTKGHPRPLLCLQRRRLGFWFTTSDLYLFPGDDLAKQAREILAGRDADWISAQVKQRQKRAREKAATEFPHGQR